MVQSISKGGRNIYQISRLQQPQQTQALRFGSDQDQLDVSQQQADAQDAAPKRSFLRKLGDAGINSWKPLAAGIGLKVLGGFLTPFTVGAAGLIGIGLGLASVAYGIYKFIQGYRNGIAASAPAQEPPAAEAGAQPAEAEKV